MSGAVALLIVHGIGDPMPGEALRDFTDALTTANVAEFRGDVEEHRLLDRSESTDTKYEFFPVTVRRGTKGDVTIRAAEVFWGSASALAPGRFGVLQGIVSLLFNTLSLIHGAHSAAGTWLNRGIHFSAVAASSLLSSAAFALNALLLSMFAFLFLHYALSTTRPPGRILVPVLAAALTAALGFIPWIRFGRTRVALWSVGAICLVVTALVRPFGVESFGEIAMDGLGIVIAETAILILLGLLAYAIAWLILGRHAGNETALLVACLQFGIWALTIPLVWSVLLRWRSQRFIDEQPWMDRSQQGPMASDGLQWLCLGVVVVAGVIVVLMRYLQARAENRRLKTGQVSAESAQTASRLILNRLIAGAIVVSTIVGCAVVVWFTLTPEQTTLAFVRSTRIPVVTGATFLLTLLLPQLRLALDLVHDVITYVYYRCDANRRPLRGPRGQLSREDPSRLRFREVVRTVVADGAVDRLLIVAHSQGSIVVIDELASWTGDLPPVTLVTFGSPMTHLYQFYFPELYPDFGADQWKPLKSRLVRWVNLYRLSDYVGTRVAFPPSEPPSPALPWIPAGQATIGTGGHNSYWSDPRLLEALGRLRLLG
jgi:hypothetical protein